MRPHILSSGDLFLTGVDDFFVSGSDTHNPGESVPHTSSGNAVTFLIDGRNYFTAIRKDVEKLQKPGGMSKFFYFANWYPGLVNTVKRDVTLGADQLNGVNLQIL